mgnify:CR=1 FL=1
MIKIELKNKKSDSVHCLLDACKTGQTAFVGKCGCDPGHSLYLIAADTIVLLNDPTTVWNDLDCPVVVDRYVDLEIKEI